MNNWPLITLEDRVDLLTGPAFSSDYFRENPPGIRLARGDNVKEGNFEWGSKTRYWPELTKNLEDYLLKEDDILIGMDGSKVGKNWARVRKKDLPCLLVQRVARLRSKQNFDQRYLGFLISSIKFKSYIDGVKTGTSIPHISGSQIKSFSFLLPPLPTQDAIARILGSLDDKIELNKQMNDTLEAMARAIFQSWFEDFDPVRAKMEGRQPAGMNAETVALFPDSLDEVDGWEVPRGWVVNFLPEVFEINPTRSLVKGQKTPYLDMKNVPTRGHRPIDWIQRAFSSGTKFINGDTLLARITPCLENGKTIFVDFLNDGEVGWGSTEYIVLRPKPPLLPEFGYLLARDEDFRAHAILNMSGSSGRQRVPSECFDSFQIVVPSKPVAEKFCELVRPLMVMIKKNDEQSRTLAQIRDALLPKLMSGEINISY
jgi:type I restriction enzyme S subunit